MNSVEQKNIENNKGSAEQPKMERWGFLTAKRPDLKTASSEQIEEFVAEKHPFLSEDEKKEMVNKWLEVQQRLQGDKKETSSSGGGGL